MRRWLSSNDRKIAAEFISKADFVRGWSGAASPDAAYKEWHHFIVMTQDCHLLLNFNISHDPWQAKRFQRLILLAHDGAWRGAVERADESAAFPVPGRISMGWGEQQLRFVNGNYEVNVSSEAAAVQACLRLEPDSQAMVSTNRELAGQRRLSWFFVPRLVAHGWISIDGRRVDVDGCSAYHDHNWGNFRWGDDFSWEWASVLGSGQQRWTTVFSRVLNGARASVRSAGLYLFREGMQHRHFLDETVSVEHQGRYVASSPSLALPRVMGLVAPSGASVSKRLVVTASDDGDWIRLTLTPRSHASIIVPSDVSLGGVTELREFVASGKIEGSVQGETVTMQGPAIVELLRNSETRHQVDATVKPIPGKPSSQ